MDVDKRGSKGGFLQLFDWNVKPRKKLFSNKSDLSGGNNGQENLVISKSTDSHLMDGNENGSRSQVTDDGYSGFTSPFCVNDGYGSRAPSVVARLMGLDSLPSAPISVADLIQHSSGQRSTNSFHFEHNIIYDNDASRNVSHPQQRVHSQSIERFQREILPPESAGSVQVTHRLISPIKGPGYMPTNNMASSMEATARIIKQGPSPTFHDKMASFSSSVPLQIRNLKQRHEGSEKGYDSQTLKSVNSYKSRKGPSRDNVQIGSRDPQIPYTCMDSKSKDKWANARRKEGLISSRNNGSINQKEGNEALKLKRQSNVQKSLQKNSVSRASDVLKQNNQKQNCIVNKDKGPANAPKSKQKEQKSRIINGTFNANKEIISTLSASKQMESTTSNSRKKSYPSNSKTVYPMEKSNNRSDHLVESDGRSDMTHKAAARSMKQNVSTDGYMNWDTNRIISMDVVSFTFTSPIKKSMPLSMLSNRGAERDRYGSYGSGGELYASGNSSLASQGLDELLEQKLKELSSRVQSSQYMLPHELNTSSSLKLQYSPLKLKTRCSTALEQGPKSLTNYQDDRSTNIHDLPDLINDFLLQDVRKQQPHEQIEEHSASTNPVFERELAGGHASSVSSLELSYSFRSYDSSMSKGSNNSLLSSGHETMPTPQKQLKAYEEVDMELSDSASSTHSSSVVRDGKDGTSTTTKGMSSGRMSQSSKWEVEYVANVISRAELSVEDVVVLEKGKAAIRQEVFDRLEFEKIGCFEGGGEECVKKMWRKVLFDYVGEFVGEKWKLVSISSGSCKEWRGLMREELEREMRGWKCVEEEIMVDEAVERDMSSGEGRWVDFEREALDQGMEMEREIVSWLVDELVWDLVGGL